MTNTKENQSLRIDKWLWAARFYKTRQLAVKALKSGQVSLKGQNLKPASALKVNDIISIKKGPYVMIIEIKALNDKRGSATIAQTMYQETEESISRREALKQQLANQPRIEIDRRKPDKRGVRSHRSLKRGNS